MGSGSNSSAANIYCVCHGQQKMAEISPTGIEVVSRHHGTYHVGSLSPRAVLEGLTGTHDGSAIVDFVKQMVETHGV